MQNYALTESCQILALNEFDIICVDKLEKYEDIFSTCPSDVAKKALAAYLHGEDNWSPCGRLNDFLLNTLHQVEHDVTTYICATVYSERQIEVRVEADLPDGSRLWVNEKIAFICLQEQKKKFARMQFHNGINIILIALHPREALLLPPYLYVQIFMERLFSDSCLFGDIQREIMDRNYNVVVQYCQDYLSIMFISSIPEQKDIFLPLYLNGRIMDIAEGSRYSFNKKYKLPLDIGDHCKCLLYEGEPFREIYCRVDPVYMQEIVKEAEKRLHKLPKEDQLMLQGRLSRLQGKLATRLEQFEMVRQIEEFLAHNNWQTKLHTGESIYYFSKIDKSYQELHVLLPEEASPESGYPVILCLSIDWYDYMPDDRRFKHCLAVSMSGRGVLGGGYINECAYLEAINVLFSHYHIDKSRVYLIGKSNGGYAAWTFLLCYPGLVAAALPISGYPILNCLENIANVSVWNAVSDKDVCYANGKHEEVARRLLGKKDYYVCEVSNMLHHSLSDYGWFDIEEFFIRHEKEEYPDCVDFVTERSCHLESHWIRLHGIRFGHKIAKVSARKIGKHLFAVKTTGTLGVTLKLKPNNYNGDIYITVNGNNFTVSAPIPEQVHFEITDDRVLTVDEPVKSDRTKGTGILGIFRTPLRILIPERADENEIHTAKAFSEPHSNGYYEWIDVKYPILTVNEADMDDRLQSLVLVNLTKNQKAVLFGDSFKQNIETRADGFSYMNRLWEGSYCVMQAIEHPFDKDKCVLMIDTNDTKLLRRNMFTRKVMLPFYQEGINPYWNNASIVFWQKQYLCCYEWGMALSEMI